MSLGMKTDKILITSLIVLIFSCKNKESNNQSVIETKSNENKNLKIQKKELIRDTINYNAVHCENEKFTIKIDYFESGKIQYSSWNKPKSTKVEPDLILTNGEFESFGTLGDYTYSFTNGDWTYEISNVNSVELEENIGVFLKLYKGKKIKLKQQMKMIEKVINSDKEQYSKNDLIGMWWTRYYAVRKVHFYENSDFKFENGDGIISIGKYEFEDKKVILEFSQDSTITMEIGGGDNDYSYTLIGDSENFVKEWKE